KPVNWKIQALLFLVVVIIFIVGDMLPFTQKQRKYCSHEATQSSYCKFAVVHTLEEHPTASAIAISADNKILVSGGKDKTIKVWDLQTGKLQKT
ncbi:MAG: WD40 repeat domain-containing protein, partial [Symploca sp. SIO1B1]|nr:WD40 repeat domain-containing protein [Symploca sp. SIO1B1]